MIGSVLFYVLYSFSRFLTGRHSGASKKEIPPAEVDGITQSRTTPLDQWPSSNSETEAENKERLKEPFSETYVTEPDIEKEQLMRVLHGDVKEEVVLKMSDVQPIENETEGERRNEQQRDREEALQKESSKITHHWDGYSVRHNTREGRLSLSGDNTPEQKLCTQLECVKMEGSTTETFSPVGEKYLKPRSEDPAVPDEPSIEITACQAQERTPSMKDTVTSEKAPAEEAECWDEYLLPAAHERQVGEITSSSEFAFPLSTDDTHLKINKQHDTQTCWHFPAGLGLAEEVCCPVWQLPAVSHYPPELTAPFEVMWRVWDEVDESASAAGCTLKPLPFTKPTMDFTVMSYNILAQDLLEASQDLYTHCPLEVLEWNYRCNLLLEEIQKWAPDILCLQEVQENHYNEQLYPVLSQMGYTCVYKRRTGNKTDGCATCYRSSCFSEVSVTLLEFFRPETELLDRHNVGIVLLLQPVVTKGSEVKAKGQLLCVANTHLLFNPRRGDVKLAQLAILLAEIDSVVKSCKGEHCNLILCGDYNSLPHTPLYQLITTGELYFQGLPAWMISGQEDQSYKVHCHRLFAPLWPSSLGITDSCHYSSVKKILKDQKQKPGKCQYSHDFLQQLRFCSAACVRPLDLELIPGVTDNTPDASRRNLLHGKSFRHTISHRLDLESVYKHTLPGSGNSEVTTLHCEGAATVDYIFYTPRRAKTTDEKAGVYSASEGLKLLGTLSLLSEDVLWSMKGLPNHTFPSDHLSLFAKFQLELNAV